MSGWEEGILLAFTVFVLIISSITAFIMWGIRRRLFEHLREHEHSHKYEDPPL